MKTKTYFQNKFVVWIKTFYSSFHYLFINILLLVWFQLTQIFPLYLNKLNVKIKRILLKLTVLNGNFKIVSALMVEISKAKKMVLINNIANVKWTQKLPFHLHSIFLNKCIIRTNIMEIVYYDYFGIGLFCPAHLPPYQFAFSNNILSKIFSNYMPSLNKIRLEYIRFLCLIYFMLIVEFRGMGQFEQICQIFYSRSIHFLQTAL